MDPVRDRANDRGRVIFDDIRGAKTGLFSDPVKEVQRWNPVVQSPKQAAYVDARQTATPARGAEVTIKGVNDTWGTPRAIAQGTENTGASQRYNPATANSPTQTAYRDARWAPGADKPLRGTVMTSLPGLNSGWDDLKPVARGFGPEAATKAPVKINTTPATPPKAPGRVSTFLGGMRGGLGGGMLGGGGGMFGKVK
jgi:hypothetical protein